MTVQTLNEDQALVSGPLILVGDIHGRTDLLQQLCEQFYETTFMLLGDVGFGFRQTLAEDLSEIATSTNNTIMFILGNHDDLMNVREHTNNINQGVTQILPNLWFCDNGGVVEHKGLNWVCIGGAVSVDQLSRTPGISWWATEELSVFDQNVITTVCDSNVIYGVLCHDIPDFTLKHWQAAYPVQSFWPPEIIRKAETHHKLVGDLIVYSGALRVVHGHMHYRYSVVEDGVVVDGLSNLDGRYAEDAVLVL